MTTANPSPSKKAPPTKTTLVCKLLSRPRGATVPEIMTATGWQNHSVRAYFTGHYGDTLPNTLALQL